MTLAAVVCALVAGSPATGTPASRFVASRELAIDLPPAAAHFDRASVWLAPRTGLLWSPAEGVARAGSQLRFAVPGDGRYGVYVRLENSLGASSEIPSFTTAPQAIIVVDTTPPVVQVHGVQSGVPDGAIRLSATIVDEHLAPGSIRMFHRENPAGPWLDGGPATFSDGVLLWIPPAGWVPGGDLRVTLADRAGNRTSEIIADTIAAEIADAFVPAGDPPPVAPPPAVAAARPVADVAPAHPVELPARPDSGAGAPGMPESEPASRPANGDVVARPQTGDVVAPPQLDLKAAAALRRQGELHLGEGRYALAAARFEDALRSAPKDPDTLVDLGGALLRLKRYDDAERRYREAIAARPDHLGALDGLALLAATQQRYGEAREHLQRLLALRPDSATSWLRCGDMDLRLGDGLQARRHWEEALRRCAGDSETARKARLRLESFQTP